MEPKTSTATWRTLADILSPRQFGRLGERSVVRRLRAGDILVCEGDPVDFSWMVIEGLLCAQQRSSSGRATTVEIFTPGNFVGCLCFLGGGRYFGDISAETAAMVRGMPTVELLDLAGDNPRLCEFLMRNMALRMRRLYDLRAIMGERSERRMCAALLWLRELVGDRVPMTLGMLGEIIGLSDETVCRIFAPLQRRGWIVVRRGLIQIENAAELRKCLSL